MGAVQREEEAVQRGAGSTGGEIVLGHDFAAAVVAFVVVVVVVAAAAVAGVTAKGGPPSPHRMTAPVGRIRRLTQRTRQKG